MMRLVQFLSLPAVASAALMCRPEGPVMPRPSLSSLKSSSIVSEATANLTAVLDDAISGTLNGGWEVKNGSFSIALVSADQCNAGVPVWEYHHLAEANTRGTKKLGRDSQYLIGSISKLLSDYVMLQTDVDIDRPITEFLPTLKEPGAMIQWGEVTLRMLGEHTAGVPANCKCIAAFNQKENIDQYRWVLRILLPERCLHVLRVAADQRLRLSVMWCHNPQRWMQSSA